VVTPLRPLDETALMRILTEPKNALVKQYQALFSMENAELNFTEDALKLIAKKAHEKDVGARGLRAIIEDVMLDILYELPEQPPASKYLVTEEVVAGRQPLFNSAVKKSA
jgi:ATP-dependent Clp protease ATP-binding subunit ClpX